MNDRSAIAPQDESDFAPSILGLTAGYRARYAAAIGAMGLGTVFLLLEPYVLKRALDALERPDTDWLRVIVPAAAAMVGLHALYGWFTFWRARWAAEASEGIVRRLRSRLFSHLERLPCDYFDRADTGDLVQRCSSDVETVRIFLAAQVVEIARVALLLGTAIPFMLWQDVGMSGLSLALVPIIVLFAVLFFRRVRHRFKEVDEAEGRLTTVLQENLTGIRVVKAFAAQRQEIAKFRERNAHYRDLDEGLFCLLANYWALSDILVLSQLGLVLVGGAYFVSQGSISVGSWILFSWLLRAMIWPVRQIGRVLIDSGKATVAIERIQEVLRERPESRAPASTIPVRGAIEIDQVSFSYRSGPKVLDRLSLAIQPGETVALLGPPGAGKSTLIALLARLYDYSEGSIRIGGRELREIDRDEVRAAFGIVLQDPFLYSKTVRENVTLGHSSAGDSEVEESARAADIHENINEFAQGYSTLVGERGVTLSGGQRQRLAIARALLKSPEFLVMDDSLSAVDTKTEAHILRALAARRGRQTTILIAHRLSSTRLADRILVLDQGRLIQCGSHDELVASDGPYRRLWRIQSELEHEMAADEAAALLDVKISDLKISDLRISDLKISNLKISDSPISNLKISNSSISDSSISDSAACEPVAIEQPLREATSGREGGPA